MAIITTSSTKFFTLIKHFSAGTLSDLDDAVNLFIAGLDADTYENYSIVLGTSYYDGVNYICAISYTRFEIDTEWSGSLA